MSAENISNEDKDNIIPQKYIVSRKFDRKSMSQLGHRKNQSMTPNQPFSPNVLLNGAINPVVEVNLKTRMEQNKFKGKA